MLWRPPRAGLTGFHLLIRREALLSEGPVRASLARAWQFWTALPGAVPGEILQPVSARVRYTRHCIPNIVVRDDSRRRSHTTCFSKGPARASLACAWRSWTALPGAVPGGYSNPSRLECYIRPCVPYIVVRDDSCRRTRTACLQDPRSGPGIESPGSAVRARPRRNYIILCVEPAPAPLTIKGFSVRRVSC